MDKDARISFRANSAVQAGLAHFAEQQGCTVSEFVRQAVEDRLAKEDEKQLHNFNPFGKLAEAARGNLQAQRDIANHSVSLAFSTDEGGKPVGDPVRMLHEGLVFARLAAAQGDAGDQGLVISMIALLATLVGEDESAADMAEAIARIELASKQGGAAADLADEMMPSLIEGVPAEVAAMAKTFRELMGA